ncbi:glycosyltransferase family 2 protein [Ferruginivarius sediminum]|nr:glycosyltransferase family 2 protein [Ferruginivarius sediminum]
MTGIASRSSIEPRASVIVPAYNEEATIGRLLDALLDTAPDIEICVACNGCRDETEDICRAYAPRVRVFVQDHASKVDALNMALRKSLGAVKVIVDADILIGARDVERLCELAERPGVDVVQPRLHYHAEDSDFAVRAYLRAWVRHPYFRTKIGAAYALSPAGVSRLGTFPQIVAEDEYVRRKLYDGALWTEDAKAHVYMPTTLWALIRIRSRSLSGAESLEHILGHLEPPPVPGFKPAFLRMLFGGAPVAAAVYAFVAAAARLRSRLRRGRQTWERDGTSRGPGQVARRAG